MTVYHASLEEDHDGTCLAHVLDLVGCTAAGATRQDAVAALPAAIRGYLDWCGAHGDPLPADGDIKVVVTELGRGRPWRRGGSNALFSMDRAPLGDSELRTYLRRMAYARGDLLEWVRALPDGTVNAPPCDGGPTVYETLAHLVETEAWYLSRLGQRILEPDPTVEITDRLIDTRARAIEAILRLAPRQRDLVYIPTEHPSENPEEGWTLRKVLRRFLEHEMDHLRRLRILYPSPPVLDIAES
jgi:predicted RNase H-like HicB family nuclease/uncharacterized damage-inducible protein DinB